MESETARFAVALVFCLLMATVAAVALTGAYFARVAIRRRAAEAGWGNARLHSTSLRPHPQVGRARTGDITYRLTAIDPDGRSVRGYVKCNMFRRRNRMVDTVEVLLAPRRASGFPVVLVERDDGVGGG